MRRAIAVVVGIVTAGCVDQGLDPVALSDSATCEGCHPDQFREWAGSMHAHASEDPVFVALEALGQRDTGGALGGLCKGCHAPFEGTSGVTCAACHQVAEVIELHNGALRWERDGAMLGGIADPVTTPAHASAYSPLLDGTTLASSTTCGGCHDVQLGELGVERTYAEWSESVFAREDVGLSCAGCHMAGRAAPAAYGERTRTVHDHTLAGVDVARPPWPGIDAQVAAIERDLAGAVSAKLCAQPAGGGVQLDVTLDNVQVGHAFPSGVTHARRAWLELVAEEEGAVTYTLDPSTWVLGSKFLGADGAEVAQVWQAAAIESALLPPAVTVDPSDPAYYHAVTRSFVVPGAPDEVRVVMKLRPIALDALDALVEAGAIVPEVRDEMPVHELAGTRRTWRRDRDGWGCAP